MKFDYYYGSQADQFSFIRIPKAMLTEKTFSSLSLQAKMLYGILLDRMALSMKNGWFDAENKVYIIYQIAEIQEDLGFSKKKAIEYLNELESFGLVEKKRRGLGLPSILYVKSFLVQKDRSRADFECEAETSRGANLETSETSEIVQLTSEKVEKVAVAKQKYSDKAVENTGSADIGTSRSAILTLQEVPVLTPLNNNTKENKTEMSNTESNHILSAETEYVSGTCDTMDEMTAYEEIIKENIGYEDLLLANPYERESIDGILHLILETVLNKSETMVIASNQYPTALVKSKFLKLNYSHIGYVLECLHHNTSKVKNIKKYLLAALFNAPSTMDSYYRAEVNHDMPYLAMARMEA